MFDKVYLIKSKSAVTNYNSSSCFNSIEPLNLKSIIISPIETLLELYIFKCKKGFYQVTFASVYLLYKMFHIIKNDNPQQLYKSRKSINIHEQYTNSFIPLLNIKL